LAAAFFFVINLYHVNSAKVEEPPYHLPFDYDPFSATGPPRWGEVNVTGNEWMKFVGKNQIDLDIDGNECDSVRRPSPLNLVANDKCRDNHEILTRQIRDTDCKFHHLNFTITPHTLTATFPLNDRHCERPTIDLPNGYPYRWHAHRIEIHLRAEHVLDGRRYDGELQMNHLGQKDQKRKVSTVSAMLDASGWEDDPKLQAYIDTWQAYADKIQSDCSRRKLGEASQARRPPTYTSSGFSSGVGGDADDAENTLYSPMTAKRAADDIDHRDGSNGNASNHRSRRTEDAVEKDGSDLESREEEVRGPRRKMFPYDLWPTIYFYRYQGQLTAPPCSEIVIWRVLDEPLLISRKQFKQLGRLLTSYVDPETCEGASAVSPRGENYRPLESINHEKQEMTHCTNRDFGFWQYPPDQQ